jgi:endonuclease YncB( thermonuclease family)
MNETMKQTKAFFLLPLLLLVALAASSPDEATGRVSKVVDGDTFDVTIQDHDSRISEDLIRIRLADIDSPETSGVKACAAGKKASAYAKAWILGRTVSLDLDDKTGKDVYGRWVAICYLDGKNFNKQLGHVRTLRITSLILRAGKRHERDQEKGLVAVLAVTSRTDFLDILETF